MTKATSKRFDFKFDGFSAPSYTPVPDDVFDVLMPHLTEAELRVLLYIVRRTFGFKRRSDAISLTQMVEGIKTREGKVLDHGTGMSRRGVMKGCAGLLAKGIVVVEKSLSYQGDNEVNVYSLRFRDGVGNEVPYGREQSRLGVGNEVPPQETVLQETGLQNNVKAKAKKDSNGHEADYYANLLADKLNDRKSLTYYRQICRRYNPDLLLQRAAEIVTDGGARNPGAAFTDWVKKKTSQKSLLPLSSNQVI